LIVTCAKRLPCHEAKDEPYDAWPWEGQEEHEKGSQAQEVQVASNVQPASSKTASRSREVEDQENHESEAARNTKKSVAPKTRSKLKTVAKKAATAAVFAGGLAALDAALGALKPKEGAASDKTEPKGIRSGRSGLEL